ncbi:GNAT family N-acetyltransferase [Jeotgalibacillus marinus]|uniref:GNAT family N-acetyltransferase n=1 Tax=Jeotgalibacillus marinus TaxID=86667 RepID=A0ABV3Q6V4_9BACL
MGTKLLKSALYYLFSFSENNEITLCVGLDNEKAIHLYKAAVFKVEHELVNYECM